MTHILSKSTSDATAALQTVVTSNLKLSHRNALFGVFSVFVLALGAQTIRELIKLGSDWSNSHASQILVVPFITAWLLWLRRKTVFQNSRVSIRSGTAVMALGGLLLVFGKTGAAQLNANDHLSLMTAAFVVLWVGGFLLIHGTAAFRKALFPLLFLFLAVPIPTAVLDWLIGILQAGSADMAYGLIRLSGTPVYRDGFIFKMPDLVIEVAPACSGIRSAIAIFISGLVAGHLFLRSTWKKLLLLSVAIPVLFFKNAVRIAVLSVIAVRWDKQVLTSSLHHDGGVLFFGLGLCLLCPVLVRLIKSERVLQKRDSLVRHTQLAN